MTEPHSDKAERRAVLVLNGWAGRREHPVMVIGETPKCYRVRLLGEAAVQLPGRRCLNPGGVALVPKTAVAIV